jgi:hypothetical protein
MVFCFEDFIVVRTIFLSCFTTIFGSETFLSLLITVFLLVFLYLFGQKYCAFTVLLKQFITTVFVSNNTTFVPICGNMVFIMVKRISWIKWSGRYNGQTYIYMVIMNICGLIKRHLSSWSEFFFWQELYGKGRRKVVKGSKPSSYTKL